MDKMASLKARWMADVMDDVKGFNNGGEADIARILAKRMLVFLRPPTNSARVN